MGGISVIGELAEIGYDAEWRVVSAAGVGAPHRRERIIIVAYPAQLFSDDGNNYTRNSMGPKTQSQFGNDSWPKNVADTNGKQLGQRRITENVGSSYSIWEYNRGRQTTYDGWKWWEIEPNLDRMVDGVPNRVDRLRGLGNAVVPQVAEYVGRLIVEHHGV
jgi:DNA (cytosine-5)-methyltransferase 1